MPSVTGTLAGITEKASGWFELEVAVPGKQYPVRMATKDAERVSAARAANEGVHTWNYTEKESTKINEKSGKPYINRYFESVEAASTEAQAGDVDWDEKERRDLASRAYAQAITALQHTFKADEDEHAQWVRVQTFQRLIYTDVTGAWGERAQSYLPEVLRATEKPEAPPPPTDAPPDLDF